MVVSPIILDIISNTSVIYIGVIAGFVFIKSPLNRYRKMFINITINVVVTILVFVSFVKIDEFEGNHWIYPIIASLIVTIIGIYFPRLYAKVLKQEEPGPAELCTASFSNALNFPFPIIFALSPDGLGAAGLFLGTSIILRNTIGLKISGMSFSRAEFMKVIKFPPLWGIFLGIIARLFFKSSVIPVISLPAVGWVFQIGIFMTLMTVGFSLKIPSLEYIQPYIRVGLSRYVISLIMAIIIISVAKLPNILAIPILVQMISPPAVYNGPYAEKFGLDTELTSQVIVMLTLLALLILPLEMYIIYTLFL